MMKPTFSHWVLGAALILTAGAALAADWPQWRGPQRDAISQETGLLKSWPAEGPKVLWEAPLGSGASACAIAGGRVFTMYQDKAKEYAVALDEKTGDKLWEYAMGAPYANVATGPRSTPTVDGDRVYFIDAMGDLACLKAADGKEVWTLNILEAAGAVISRGGKAKNIPWAVAGSPFISGDRLVVNPGVDPANRQGASIMALDKMTGKVLWKSGNDLASYSTPMEMKVGGVDTFVLLTGENVVGVRASDGKLLWSFPWPNRYQINVPTPLVRGDQVFVTTGYDVGCTTLQVIPAGGNFTVKPLYPISKSMRCRYGNPILIGDHVYGFDDRKLACVEWRSGKKMWEQDGFGYGALSMAEGLFYIMGEKGNLALARLTPEKFEKIGETPIFAGQREALWVVPTVANGRLYVRGLNRLVCLNIKAN